MNHTVFYAWQTDLPEATNKAFIRDTLTAAIKAARKDGVALEKRPEEDARGRSGAADVPAAIFDMIERCSVFVGDVSIINGPRSFFALPREASGQRTWRPTPNPNVLVELGYAVRCLRWENVIPVLNLAFGDVEQLPFDFRHRHILAYRLAPDDDPAAAFASLVSQLTGWLRSCLAGVEAKQTSEQAAALSAEWRRQNGLIAILRQEFLASHDGISPAMLAGMKPLPKEWVETRLAEMGEGWRRGRYWELDQPR